MNTDGMLLLFMVIGFLGTWIYSFLSSLSWFGIIIVIPIVVMVLFFSLFIAYEFFSKQARDRRKKIETINELSLLNDKSPNFIKMDNFLPSASRKKLVVLRR